MALSPPRLSAKALKAVVAALRAPPVRHLLAGILRKDLGIDALMELPPRLRGPLPTTLSAVRARHLHHRPSEGLGLPTVARTPQSAVTLGAALRAGSITPTELAERALRAAREAARRGPGGGPLLTYDDAGARAAAEDAARRLAAGERGALLGIPVVVKEEVALRGFPTRLGTSFLPHDPEPDDAPAIARLRAAGAVILGQTPMTEYGMSPLGGNVHRDMPRNAHAPDRLPGGSSSGTGVAVALGVVPVGLGTDGGGSVRIPACFNGVFGLKPTFGRIPKTGDREGSGSSVVHLGPLGASSFDLAAFLELTAGGDEGDPSSLEQPTLESGALLAALGRGVKGLRIGVPESEWADAAPSVARAGRAALAALEKEGAVLVPVELELACHAPGIGYLTIGLESMASLTEERAHHFDAMGDDLKLLLRGLTDFRADDYLVAQSFRSTLRTELAALLRTVDVLALPTTARTAPRVSEAEARQGFSDPMELSAACRFSFLGNVTGVPCGTAPVGVDEQGLPIGLQIVGDAWDEACVLQVLAHLERIGAARVPRAPHAVDLLA